ncbi:MAG TPA: LCCL domain-containing protein [Acidimicrobiales bacterium]|nr:LCCL domain-containing protein [Acidimicrobiales bacterium]
MRRLLALLAIAFTLAACGGGKDKVSTATTVATTSTTVAATTTAPPATAPPVTAAPTPTTARPVAAASGVQGGGYGWLATARHLRTLNGRRFTFGCPGGGAAGSVWGSGPYTDDSSVCTAGVHAGAITQAAGGAVLIEIRAGQATYAGSTARGVTTKPFGKYEGSYVVLGPATIPGGGYGTANARQLRGKNGERFAFGCPPANSVGTVYGSNPYTDDSSVCTAGVHAGVITQAAGGNVVIEIRPGQASYPSTPAHGVTPKSYGKWDGSFAVVK